MKNKLQITIYLTAIIMLLSISTKAQNTYPLPIGTEASIRRLSVPGYLNVSGTTTFSGPVNGIDKTTVGLPNVNNTSDTNKPVSTATQTALNLKAPVASPAFTGTVTGITATMVGAPMGSGNSTGINTGDETTTTIKQKLGVQTLSGSNTGDQDLSGYATITNLAAKQAVLVSGGNIKTINGISLLGSGNIIIAGGAGAETAATIKTKLGIETLSGSNTGDQDLSLYATNANLNLKAPLASPAFTGSATIGGNLTTGGNVIIGTAGSPNNLTVTRDATITGTLTSGSFFPSKIGIGVTDSLDALSVVGNGVFTGDVQTGSGLRATTLSTTGNASIGGMLTAGAFAPVTINVLKNSLGLSGINTGDLVSGTSIKTINGVSLLGSGDITITGGNGVGGADATKLAKLNNLSDLNNISAALTNLGLGNVTNTSDANKPVSTAQQTALNLKADKVSPTFTGTVSADVITTAGALTTGGNVAIGTTASPKNLTVSGTLSVGTFAPANIATGTLTTTGNVGIGTTTSPKDLIVTGTLSAGTFAPTSIATGTLTTTGNVGIGTTTSPKDLIVTGTLSAGTFAPANITTGTLTTTGNVGIGTSTSPKDLTVTGTLNTGTFAPATITTGKLTTTGNVGIGVGIPASGPVAQLHVIDNTNTWRPDSGIMSESNSNAGGRITLRNSSSTKNKPGDVRDWSLYNVDANYGSGLQFWRYSVGGSNDGSAMFLSDNGNVGIGTSSPSAKLHVVGSTIITGVLNAVGDVNIGTTTSPKDLIVTGTLSAGTFAPTSIATGTLTTTGNVSIGTATSQKDLIVTGTLSAGTFAPTSIATGTLTTTGNVGIGTTTSPKNLTVTGTLNAGTFAPANITTGKLTTTGNVGIGVGIPASGPVAQLHVIDNTNTWRPDSGIMSESNSNAGGRITLRNSSSTKNKPGDVRDWSLYNVDADYGSGLQFWRYSEGGSNDGSAMFLSDNGNVGIGTSKPLAKFHVVGSATITDVLNAMGDVNIGAGNGFNTLKVNGNIISEGIGKLGLGTNDPKTKLHVVGSATITDRVTIGDVTSTPAGYKLFVENGILTEKVRVAVLGSANWADYVFHDDYKLMPLNDVEQYIKTNNHLPNVLSASEMIKEGNDLGKTDAKLLEKIEELTLYMIEMKKELGELKKENEDLKSDVLILKK